MVETRGLRREGIRVVLMEGEGVEDSILEVMVGTLGGAVIHDIPEDVGEAEVAAEVADTLLDRTTTADNRL
jgi:hypothetical protein